MFLHCNICWDSKPASATAVPDAEMQNMPLCKAAACVWPHSKKLDYLYLSSISHSLRFSYSSSCLFSCNLWRNYMASRPECCGWIFPRQPAPT